MIQDIKPIVIEQTFNSSVSNVWDAITRLDEMKQWFFNNIPSFDPVVGFETEFTVKSNNRIFHHLWKLLVVEPNKKIKYSWRYKDYRGEGFVIFELFENGEKTLLRITNEGLETFPQDIPEFARESCEAGWKFFVQENLRTYLDGKNDQL